MPRSDIETFVYNFREAVEPCWVPDTGAYSPGLFPVDYAVPLSGGQCVSTSGCLFDGLRGAFPGQRRRFLLSVGALYVDRVVALDHHTFVTYHPKFGRPPIVADTTPDQAPDITEKVIYGDMLELAGRGLVYCIFTSYPEIPEQICEDVPPGTPPVPERIATLRQRMDARRNTARPIG